MHHPQSMLACKRITFGLANPSPSVVAVLLSVGDNLVRIPTRRAASERVLRTASFDWHGAGEYAKSIARLYEGGVVLRSRGSRWSALVFIYIRFTTEK